MPELAPGRYRVIKKPCEWECPGCHQPAGFTELPDEVTVRKPASLIMHCSLCGTHCSGEGWYEIAVVGRDGSYMAVPWTRLAPLEAP